MDDFLECIASSEMEANWLHQPVRRSVSKVTLSTPCESRRDLGLDGEERRPSLWAHSEDSSGVGHIPAGRPLHSVTSRSEAVP